MGPCGETMKKRGFFYFARAVFRTEPQLTAVELWKQYCLMKSKISRLKHKIVKIYFLGCFPGSLRLEKDMCFQTCKLVLAAKRNNQYSSVNSVW